ncbi:MAG: cytochrome ubiquinol oxidase subunit I [Limnochordales bacterium]|nr:cytochrome ubiquinol oxidase subunit I [Limnochordales bacterium]
MDPLTYGRALTGIALAVHITLAVPGIGLPLFIAIAHFVGLRRRDPHWMALADQWTRLFAILFPIGAVTGTLLPVLLVVLWPVFMQIVGEVGVLPMFVEGFAFFIEAIFLGLYLYGREKLHPWVHWATSLPLVLGSAASAFLITTVNAWMQTPTGFHLEDGKVSAADPMAAMFNPSTWVETGHVLVTTYLTVAFFIAGWLAWQSLRHPNRVPRPVLRKGVALALVVGFISAAGAAGTGHLSAQSLAVRQPLKLAAIEALFDTEGNAPLTIGGWPDPETGRVIGGIEIPSLLSIMVYGPGGADGVIKGLRDFPRELWPPLIVHLTFDLMVGIGILLLVIPLLYWAGNWLTRRRQTAQAPRTATSAATSPDANLGVASMSSSDHLPPMLEKGWFQWLLAASGPLAFVAMQSGWLTTELGRQPWMLYEKLTVAAAFTTADYVPALFWAMMVGYAIIVGVAVLLLRRVLARHDLAAELERAGRTLVRVVEATTGSGARQPGQPAVPTQP